MTFKRAQINTLQQRILEPPQWMIVVAGPRQVGKSTMVKQLFSSLDERLCTFVAADQPLGSNKNRFGETTQTTMIAPGASPTAAWIIQEWHRARSKANVLPEGQHHILAIDEIQKIPRWSEIIKGLWDEDRSTETPLHIILLGSSPLLMQKGLSESLAGRYEIIAMPHWSYAEMQGAFDFSLDQYIYFGGYPGSARLINEESRWRAYVRDSLIYPNINNDILQMTRVDKPILLKKLFELGCGAYSGQIISYTKLVGELQDAGNTVTLAHYLQLLSQAGLLTGLQKYAGQEHRQRSSPPKLNAHNTALISAIANYTFLEAKNDREYWGRLVESSVGAHLINTKPEGYELFYWRESPYEVDFVITKGKKILAIEVKSGPRHSPPKGLIEFPKKYPNVNSLIVGGESISLPEFLLSPISRWFE